MKAARLPTLTELQTLLENDTEADRLGHALAQGLQLRRDREFRTRYQTGWGSKTARGISRTVVAQLAQFFTPGTGQTEPSA